MTEWFLLAAPKSEASSERSADEEVEDITAAVAQVATDSIQPSSPSDQQGEAQVQSSEERRSVYL